MRRRLLVVARAGLLASLVAVVATAAVAALATAVGVELEVPADGETIPLSGIALVSGVFSLAGVVIAAACCGGALGLARTSCGRRWC